MEFIFKIFVYTGFINESVDHTINRAFSFKRLINKSVDCTLNRVFVKRSLYIYFCYLAEEGLETLFFAIEHVEKTACDACFSHNRKEI